MDCTSWSSPRLHHVPGGISRVPALVTMPRSLPGFLAPSVVISVTVSRPALCLGRRRTFVVLPWRASVSNTPDVPDAESGVQPKRRRGRPRRVPPSKNLTPGGTPGVVGNGENAPTNPADVGEMGSGGDTFRELLRKVLAAQSESDKENGGDLMREILPLIAKHEIEEKAAREGTSEVAKLRALAGQLRDQHASIFRYNASLSGLLPFRLRREKRIACEDCQGTGVRTCGFCSGMGCLDADKIGEPGSTVEFDGRVGVVPSMPAMLDSRLCPFCLGAGKERCERCDATGVLLKDGPAPEGAPRAGTGVPGAARSGMGMLAVEPISREKFIEENKEYIEFGQDGVIIRRKRKIPKKKAAKSKSGTPATGGGATKKRRRGRPKKGQSLDDVAPLQDPDMSNFGPQGSAEARKVRSSPVTRAAAARGPPRVTKSTDFVNTRLRQMGANTGSVYRQDTADFSEELNRALASEDDDDI